VLQSIIGEVNNARHPRELEGSGLLPVDSGFSLHFQPSTHLLKPERDAIAIGDHCGLIVAGVKDTGRALAKVLSDYAPDLDSGDKTEGPAGRYICDWLRATVFSEDPYALSVVFAVFRTVFDFVRVKNNFVNERLGPLQRTNVLANFRMYIPSLGVKHTFEIQFKLQDLFTITLAEHRFYDIIRAQSIHDIVSRPIFTDLEPAESIQELLARAGKSAHMHSFISSVDGVSFRTTARSARTTRHTLPQNLEMQDFGNDLFRLTCAPAWKGASEYEKFLRQGKERKN